MRQQQPVVVLEASAARGRQVLMRILMRCSAAAVSKRKSKKVCGSKMYWIGLMTLSPSMAVSCRRWNIIWPPQKLPMLLLFFLDATFPPQPSVRYFSADDWDSYGRKYARPWMFGWKKHTGNKGFIQLEKFRNLLPLILVNGFESNPDEPRGQQMRVSKPNPLLYPTAADGQFPAIAGEGLLGAGELHHMKGWTRSVGLHMALLCVLESGQMDNFLKTATPHLHTYQTIFCNYVQYDSASAQIDASRGCYCC